MKKEINLLILTSTLPRWSGDSTPPFVKNLALHIGVGLKSVRILAPHAKNAKNQEKIGENIEVRRYRYMYPVSAQTIAYDGGAVGKIKKSPLYIFKLLCLIGSLFFNTLRYSLFKKNVVINAHWLIPQGFVAILVKLMFRKKVVITVHGSDVFSLNGKVMTLVKRFSLKHADVVIVNSSATYEACMNIYEREYLIIPMGINMEHFSPGKKPLALMKKYNLSDFTVLYVGRLSEEKGVIYLLKALSLLRDEGVSFKVLIVGEGPTKPSLESFVKQNYLADNVVFTGWVDSSDLVDYYRVADVMVGPSLHEALGLVFVEASAVGLPVIATNTGGIRDVVKNGETGYLVDAMDHEALYKKVLALHDNELRAKLSKQSRAFVEDTFSWNTVAKKYIDVISSVNR